MNIDKKVFEMLQSQQEQDRAYIHELQNKITNIKKIIVEIISLLVERKKCDKCRQSCEVNDRLDILLELLKRNMEER